MICQTFQTTTYKSTSRKLGFVFDKYRSRGPDNLLVISSSDGQVYRVAFDDILIMQSK